MNRRRPLDPVLNRIEFPGEEETLIRTWLGSRDFAGSVTRESRRLRVVSPRTVLWACAAAAVTGAGIVAGGSPVIEAAGEPISTFAFLLFGVLVTVSLVGLFATLHPSWQGDAPPPQGPSDSAAQTRP